MNIKSERGQAVVPLALIALIVFAVVYFGLIANQRNIADGADAIGNAVGETIDNYDRDQGIENLIWQIENGAVTQFWLNHQKLYPNKHAVDKHKDDAWATTNCYNNNGAIQMWMIDPFEFHLLCREANGTIRDLILGRESANSNTYFLKNAFTPKDGTLSRVLYWLKGKGGTQITPPSNITITIDGMVP